MRAVLPERPLKGEKVVRTEVMYFVSMSARSGRKGMKCELVDGLGFGR
jgi:hypothetical protein